MKNNSENYYVYVYIDPRNFEEFYYGKGKGSRKEAHKTSEGDSEKIKRIKDIQKIGKQPIIRVIARGLSEAEAFLVEKTLIWKLGKNLTNISSGHFAKKFRPHDNLYRDLAGFDFRNGIYYVNVGQDRTRHRVWEDCLRYGFLAAGGDRKWSGPLRELNKDDIVVAYLKHRGYVGIGRVITEAIPVDEFKCNGKPLRDLPLQSASLLRNHDNEKTDYLVKIDWIKAIEAKQGKWRKNGGLFAAQRVKISLQNQPKTIVFLEKEFGIKFDKLLVK